MQGHSVLKTEESVYGMKPQYLHHNVWDPNSEFSRTTADWTEMAQPLPQPLLEEGLSYPPIVPAGFQWNPVEWNFL